MEKRCFGVDIGGTTVKMGLFTTDGKVLRKWEIVTRKEDKGRWILSDIAASIQNVMKEEKLEKEQITGIGFGVPGPVMEDGTVLKCANLGWGVFSVTKAVQKLTGIQNIKVANDANVAALGEMWKGGGRGFKNLVMVTLGTGVGGGVIINGNILTGNKGAAGEIGHLNVNPRERETCGCGKKGCLEQYASATGIGRVTRRALKRYQGDTVLSKRKITAKVIFDAAKAGDAFAMKMVEEFGVRLGSALAQIAQVIDPDVFVIGGGVSKAGQIILDVIEKNYKKNVMFALKNKEFRLAELGNDAGIYGSARMVIKE